MRTTKPDKAIASPTKAFFVSMLTRDISLVDAILDLVDNSLDGILRTYGSSADYSKYWAKIAFDESEFSITDNAGGLERDIAAKYAFKMGRDDGDGRDDDVETIGMYGIGMKRAMFKMGRDCRLLTRTVDDDSYQVAMDRPWLESRNWNKLPLRDIAVADRLKRPGTMVRVQELQPGIQATFREANFLKELMESLGEHFTKFLKRGFVVTVNGKRVEPVRIEILYEKGDTGVKPYFMTFTSGNTTAQLTMGLNSRAKDDGGAAATSLAVPGWSVFCNDRAVLVGDTTRLTGWGDPPVPRYHEQYDILTGVVEFRAKDARDLPVTTTKRDLDASSEAWLIARGYMRVAARKMISHTNAWKNSRAEHRAALKKATPLTIEAVLAEFESGEARSLPKKQAGTEYLVYNPERSLPAPAKSASQNRKIVFSRPKRKVEQLGEALLEDAQAAPGDIGAAGFDFAYRELVRGSR